MSNLVPVAIADLTIDAVVKASPGAVVAVSLTAGADAATLILYDNATTSTGTKLITVKAAINTTVTFTPSAAWVASLGIFADLSGTLPVATVLYT